MRNVCLLRFAIGVSVAFSFFGCKPDQNQVVWGTNSVNSTPSSTNGYFTLPEQYPGIGFVQMIYDPAKIPDEKVIETGMTLCRSDFRVGFEKGILIEWNGSGDIRFSPLKVVFILLPINLVGSGSPRQGTTFVVDSSDLFGDRPISEVIDRSTTSKEGFTLDESPDGYHWTFSLQPSE